MPLHRLPSLRYPQLTALQLHMQPISDKADLKSDSMGAARVHAWLAQDPVRHGIYAPLDRNLLTHPLSPYFASRSIGPRSMHRSDIEILAYSTLVGTTSPPGACVSFKDFVSLIVAIRIALDLNPALRTANVCTSKDQAGDRVLFPDSNRLIAMLEELARQVAYWQARDSLIAGSIALAAFCHIHPFQDGNGRTARILFNHISFSTEQPQFYLPICEISALSEGGFILRSRQARYFGDWQQFFLFISYLSNCFLISSEAVPNKEYV